MANPKSKTPSRKQIKDSQSAAERIEEYGPKIKKFFPQFDKLTMKQKDSLALKKAIQDVMKDNERYTDEGIRNEGLSMLGVASSDLDSTLEIGKDSAGRPTYAFQQKKQNPAGFAHGGKVHRGRKAHSSIEKA